MALSEQMLSIISKIEAGEELSQAEEVIYFMEAFGYTKEEAEQKVFISQNKRPGLFID